jgi:carbonic anhydrase
MDRLKVPLKYIGIPFSENGTDFTGINCLNLAKIYVENELNVKVSQVPADIQKAQENCEKYRSLLEDIAYNALIPGDIAFFSFQIGRASCRERV